MEEVKEQFYCRYCFKYFQNDITRRTHISRKHHELHEARRKYELLMKKTCCWCLRVFDQSYNCQVHQPGCQKRSLKLAELMQDDNFQEVNQENELQDQVYYEYEIDLILTKLNKYLEKHNITNKKKKPCLPINADISKPELLHKIAKSCQITFKALFSAVMIDFPWNMGYKLPYPTLNDTEILKIPIGVLQDNGYIFLWVVNKKKRIARKILESNGYKEVDSIVWVKLTKRLDTHKGWGYYVLHSKEECIIAKKGKVFFFDDISKTHKSIDVIFEVAEEHSKKPNQIYDVIEILVKKGPYLELFGRTNNKRGGWVTIGNQA